MAATQKHTRATWSNTRDESPIIALQDQVAKGKHSDSGHKKGAWVTHASFLYPRWVEAEGPKYLFLINKFLVAANNNLLSQRCQLTCK